MAMYKAAAASAAKARMAKRARRQRFWKENKKRILYGVVIFLLLVFLALGTPWGPNYYYGKIQARKMASPQAVSDGVLRDLYKLGVFYQYTMREQDALRMFNEMATLYYGFTLSEYATNPDRAFEKRRDAEIRIERGQSNGPPFRVSNEDMRYIPLAIWKVGEIIQKTQSRQFTVRLYDELYINEFLELHPELADPEVTSLVRASVDRFKGLR